MSDLVWPVPRLHGRSPAVSHEFEPGVHLGVDIGWHWQDGDPIDASHRNRRGAGPWVILADAPQIAAADGEVLYSEWRSRGHATRIRTPIGIDILYMHGERGSGRVYKGNHVGRGDRIATIGADPTDPEGWRHLHFEVRQLVPHGTPGRDGWGGVPVDPWPYLRLAPMLDRP